MSDRTEFLLFHTILWLTGFALIAGAFWMKANHNGIGITFMAVMLFMGILSLLFSLAVFAGKLLKRSRLIMELGEQKKRQV